MRLAAAAVTLLLLTGIAHAQGPAINLWNNENGRNPEQRQKDEEIDRAYKEKLKSQGGTAQPAATNDPWGTVRSNEKPAAQSKTQGTKTR